MLDVAVVRPLDDRQPEIVRVAHRVPAVALAEPPVAQLQERQRRARRSGAPRDRERRRRRGARADPASRRRGRTPSRRAPTPARPWRPRDSLTPPGRRRSPRTRSRSPPATRSPGGWRAAAAACPSSARTPAGPRSRPARPRRRRPQSSRRAGATPRARRAVVHWVPAWRRSYRCVPAAGKAQWHGRVYDGRRARGIRHAGGA